MPGSPVGDAYAIDTEAPECTMIEAGLALYHSARAAIAAGLVTT